MKNEWIEIPLLYPRDKQKVKIKVYNSKTKEIVEIKAIYYEDELSRMWQVTMAEGADIIHRPTHWKEDDEE